MLVSLLAIPIPTIVQNSLTIISGMALPTALLIIGGSLSLERIRAHGTRVFGTVAAKLLLLPAVGWGLYLLCGVTRDAFIPGLILLASPTATISYVMAREMGGDGDLAVAAITASTLASAVTFVMWLKLASL
jgi:hypothetical protein